MLMKVAFQLQIFQAMLQQVAKEKQGTISYIIKEQKDLLNGTTIKTNKTPFMSTEIEYKNNSQLLDDPQIHLSATDGSTVNEATELVFHKMGDGTLFIEWYTHENISHIIHNLQTNLSKEAKEKLIAFLQNEVTY